MVEDGLAEMDDLLKDRIAALKADRETAHAALARARGTNRAPIVIPGDKIAAFGKLMRERCQSARFRSEKHTSAPSSTASRWTTIRSASAAGKTCWNKRFWRTAARYPGFAVLYALALPTGTS